MTEMAALGNAEADVASGALALAADPSVIERAADPGEFIVQACARARIWLREALERGDIEQIAECKSQAEAIRVYTVSRQLGKDAQLSATEIVRRAERGIGVAIRRGQRLGEMARQGQIGGRGARGIRGGVSGSSRNQHLVRPAAAAGARDNSGLQPIYDLTDGVSDEVFEDALAEAKAGGNLSRANLARKIGERRGRGQGAPGDLVPEPADRSPAAAQARRELIARLAADRMTSRQIAARLGISDQRVREIARGHGIPVPADAVVGRTRRPDSTRIVRETATALEGLVMGIDLADPAELDPADAAVQAASIARSARTLSRFARQITEVTR